MGSTRSGGDRSEQSHREIGQEERTWAQWQAIFSDETDPGVWIEGWLRFTPHSRWLVLLDLENDVLAGDFLAMDDQIKVGSRLRIDIYDVVVDHHVQVSPNAEDSIELIDLSSMSEGWKPDTRVGGRFLVLADSEEDDKSESDEVAEDYGKVEVRTAAPAMTRDAEKPIAHRINVT